MQRRQTLPILGFVCFILILSLLACSGSEGNNISQQAPAQTGIVSSATATQPSPTQTQVISSATATQPSPTQTQVTPSATATQAPPNIPTLIVKPGSLNPHSANCSSNGDGTYTCNVTLEESPQGYLHWSVTNNLNVSINPSNGELTPAQPEQQVTLDSIPCHDGIFTFSDQGGNTIPVNWSCQL